MRVDRVSGRVVLAAIGVLPGLIVAASASSMFAAYPEEWPKQVVGTNIDDCSLLVGMYADRADVGSSSKVAFGDLPARVSSGDLGLSELRKGDDGRSGGTDRIFEIAKTQAAFVLRTVDAVSGAEVQQRSLPIAACRQGVLRLQRSSGPIYGDGMYVAHVRTDLELRAAMDGSLVVFERYIVEQRDFLVIKHTWESVLWYRFFRRP
jgi:hypothetical protein